MRCRHSRVSYRAVAQAGWLAPRSVRQPISLQKAQPHSNTVRSPPALSFLPRPRRSSLMTSRFKNLVGSSRRKSSNTNPAAPTLQPSPPAPSPQNGSSSLSTAAPSNATSSTTSLPQGAQPATAMNNQQPLGRPPSYTYANPQMGQPPHGARPHSPMPPPINTATQPAGYPPQQIYGNAPAAPPNYPPNPAGYGGYGQPAPAPAAYNRPGAAEVDGTGRGKAQLIVGIDFVRCRQTTMRYQKKH